MAGAKILEGGVIIKGWNRHLTLRCHSQNDLCKTGGDLNPFPVDTLFIADARVTLLTMLIAVLFSADGKVSTDSGRCWFVIC